MLPPAQSPICYSATASQSRVGCGRRKISCPRSEMRLSLPGRCPRSCLATDRKHVRPSPVFQNVKSPAVPRLWQIFEYQTASLGHRNLWLRNRLASPADERQVSPHSSIARRC